MTVTKTNLTSPESFADVAHLVQQAQPLLDEKQVASLRKKGKGLNRLAFELLTWLDNQGGTATVDQAVQAFAGLSVREVLYLCISHIDMAGSGPDAGPDGMRMGIERGPIDQGILQAGPGLLDRLHQFTLLESEEAARVLLHLDLAAQLAGMYPDEHFRSLSAKLLVLLGNNCSAVQTSAAPLSQGAVQPNRTICGSAALKLATRPAPVSQNLSRIARAVSDNTVLQFVYVDESDRVTSRQVIVKEVRRTNGADMVLAHDLDKDSERTFLVQRMSDVINTDQVLERVLHKSGGPRGGFEVSLTVRRQARWLTEKHNVQWFKEVRSGYQIGLHFWSEAALVDTICRLGKNLLRIRGKDHVVAEVAKRASQALELYSVR